jgi:hypothetical protein
VYAAKCIIDLFRPTGDAEWYDPSAVTTANGKMVITMTETLNHELNFMSGMSSWTSRRHTLTLRIGMVTSWNQLCFTTGYVEVSVSMPGSPRAPGLWPAAWTMGNLGRAGYGATTDGHLLLSHGAPFPDARIQDCGRTLTTTATSARFLAKRITIASHQLPPASAYYPARDFPRVHVRTLTTLGQVSVKAEAHPKSTYSRRLVRFSISFLVRPLLMLRLQSITLYGAGRCLKPRSWRQ